MKSILYSFLSLTAASTLFFSCVSTSFDPPREEVFEFEGVDQDTLFVHTGEFLASYIRDSRVANEFVDKEGGKIVGDFVFNIPYDLGGVEVEVFVNYNVTVRDEKVQIVLEVTKIIDYSITRWMGSAAGTRRVRTHFKGSAKRVNRHRMEIAVEYEAFFREYKAYVDGLIADNF